MEGVRETERGRKYVKLDRNREIEMKRKRWEGGV